MAVDGAARSSGGQSVRVSAAVLVAWCAVMNLAVAAGGTEKYSYDARGRLTQVVYPDGSSITYSYDAAGNRTSSGKAPSPPPPPPPAQGTFKYVSGTHTSAGSTGDVATVTISNSGTLAISSISMGCSGGSWTPTGATTLATLNPGANASFQCTAMASGSYSVVFTFSGSSASNSPFTAPAF